MSKNLLFLFTDQQRHDTLAAGGNHTIKVPNLNRLAKQSVVFTQAYVTQPDALRREDPS
jgi:arylsulfatase A-like enzyme